MNRSINLIVAMLLGAGVAAGAGYQWYQNQKHQHDMKVWLQTPVDLGYQKLKNVDAYIKDFQRFPGIDDIREHNLRIVSPSIAYALPEPDLDNIELGELHLVLPNSGVDEALINQKVIFILGADKQWTCTTTVADEFRPDNCKAEAPPQPVYAG
jgi:hypothetical protein